MLLKLPFCRLCPLVGCMLLLFLWSTSCKPGKPEQDNNEFIDTCTYQFGICVDSLNVSNYTVKSGDNLSAIFSRIGISANQSEAIYKASSDFLDPKKLQPGLSFYAISSQDSLKSIRYIVFAKTSIEYTIIDLTGQQIMVYSYQKEITQRQQYISGSVKSSLWNEIIKLGANPILAVQIADIFAWQIDFFAIQPKDSFQILFTTSFRDDTVPINRFTIDGAVFIHDRKTYTAIPFMQDSSMVEYFDEGGQSLRREFLKAPLEAFRITSRFTNARYHPILRITRAHYGVDYAAPSGTPVKSIGSGKVVAKGYEAGGGGNYLKIQHNSVYTTSYMHLRGFAKDIQVGKQVQQGEVIGYVGSTGLSTGPHLDFRVFKNGTPIDPLKMESPPAYPVKTELKDSFETVKQQILQIIDNLELQAHPELMLQTE